MSMDTPGAFACLLSSSTNNEITVEVLELKRRAVAAGEKKSKRVVHLLEDSLQNWEALQRDRGLLQEVKKESSFFMFPWQFLHILYSLFTPWKFNF